MARAMAEFGSGGCEDAERLDALNRARLLGQLKSVLAIAGDAATDLRSFVYLGDDAARALTELQNALAQADRLADTLLKQQKQEP